MGVVVRSPLREHRLISARPIRLVTFPSPWDAEPNTAPNMAAAGPLMVTEAAGMAPQKDLPCIVLHDIR